MDMPLFSNTCLLTKNKLTKKKLTQCKRTKKTQPIASVFFNLGLGSLHLGKLLLALSLICTSGSLLAATSRFPVLVIPTDQPIAAIDLAPYWQVFDDDIKEQLELALQPNTPLASHSPKRLTLSTIKPDLWLRLDLHSAQATNQWFLQIGPGQLSRMTLYFFDQHQQPNLQTTGRVYPQQQAVPQLQYSGGYLLPLPLRSGDQAVLLNIHHAAPTNIQLQLVSQAGLERLRPSQQHWSGLWTGGLLGLLLLQIYLGWQQKFRAFYGLALANAGWVMAYIIEQKIGLTSIFLAALARTPVLSHVLMGLSWTLYLQLIKQALNIEIYFSRWHRLVLATLALTLMGSLSLPLWSEVFNSHLGLSLFISASALLMILACYFCRQASVTTRVLIVLLCVSSILSVNLEQLMSLLPGNLNLPWANQWLHLSSLAITLLLGHTLIQFQQWQQLQDEQTRQQKHQRQLLLQRRQLEWHNRLHQQCLQQIQSSVGELVASLANNPTREVSPTLHRVHHALQRVQNLAADGPVQSLPFLLKPLLMQLARECLERCKTKNLKFHVAFDKKLPLAVRGDARLLHRLLHELLRNAVDYTTQGDVIFKVSTRSVPGRQADETSYSIDFLIQDTGNGLPEQHVETGFKVNQPAAKAMASQKLSLSTNSASINTASKRSPPNSTTADPSHDVPAKSPLAMGLVICRHLVQLLQGNLQIKSVSGQGSRFMVRLNLAATDPEHASADPLNDGIAPLRLHAPHKAGVELALVLDDNRVTQQSLSTILKKLGYKSFIAASSAAAIDILALNAIDLILMDCDMAEVNGFETLATLRAMPHHKRVPAIAIGAYPQAEFHAKAVAGGFNHYIEKPITREKISECLHSIHLEAPTEETLLS